MHLKPQDLSYQNRYKLAIGSVLPRPIAWVSTMDAAGRLNAAPFSFFTVACTDPLTLLFSAQIPQNTGQPKDTLNNIRALGEFVVNICNEDTAEAMNLTATVLPPGDSEFDWAGITPAESQSVRVPRIAEAPIAYECRLQQIVMVNDQPGGSAVIFGEVQGIYVAEGVYEDSYVRLDRLKPVGRLAGSGYCRVTDLFEMDRVAPPKT